MVAPVREMVAFPARALDRAVSAALARLPNRRPRPAEHPPVPPLPIGDAPYSLRCEHCDVMWRGSPSVPCWCCGAPGAIRGEVRMFAD